MLKTSDINYLDDEVINAYAGGEAQVSIAKRFGTSQGYISNIIKGRVWNEQKHPDNGL